MGDVEWESTGPGVHIGAPSGCACNCEHPAVSQEELLAFLAPWADIEELRAATLQGFGPSPEELDEARAAAGFGAAPKSVTVTYRDLLTDPTDEEE